jgi:hypothetical protein
LTAHEQQQQPGEREEKEDDEKKKKQKIIFCHHFFLFGRHVACTLGVRRVAVRRTHGAALTKLRRKKKTTRERVKASHRFRF